MTLDEFAEIMHSEFPQARWRITSQQDRQTWIYVSFSSPPEHFADWGSLSTHSTRLEGLISQLREAHNLA